MSDKQFRDGKAFKSLDEALTAIQNPESHTITIDDGQRQLIIMALAHLSMESPGWIYALEEIALKMDNQTDDGRPQMFESFRRIHSEAVAAKLIT